MLLLTTALAASVSALVDVTPDGLVLRDAVLLNEDVPSTPGALQVLDADGAVLATADVEAQLHRSILFEEGGGAAVELQSGTVRVRVQWPEGASSLTLGQRSLSPRTVPPASAVQESGPSADRLDIVVLGDGYTADQQDLFVQDADEIVDYLLSIEPYGAYAGLFNIWRIDAVSNDSGASHYDQGQNQERDTAYGCYYGCGGIDRLLCCNDSKVMGAVNSQVPQADGVLVLVNDPTYGGAGGFNYATSYTGDVGALVAAHEVGHSLVGLWDEYSYGYSTNVGEGLNCTANPNDPPWAHWLDEGDVGAFEVCSYTNYYRPTDTSCMMRTLQDDYCPICREQAVLSIYDAVPSLISADEGPVTLPAVIEVIVLGPDDGDMDASWAIDGVDVAEGLGATVPCVQGGQSLTLTVADSTPWVRNDPEGLLTDVMTWSLEACSEPDSGGEDTDEPPSIVPPCGCSAPGAVPVAALLPLLLVAVRRKRV